MKIALGSDHAGYVLKEKIKYALKSQKYEIIDVGTFSEEPVDYPDYIIPAAEQVRDKNADLGIVFGGSGNGEVIAANKVKGIRCALCWNIESAQLAKEHNDANMISIGSRMIKEADALKIAETWLTSKFEQGRHINRIKKISDYENK